MLPCFLASLHSFLSFGTLTHLQNNKTKKYFSYAIGEIVLVVIGILIALQINNWNEARKEQRVLKEYLVKIKSHTLKDLQQLEELSKGRKQIAELCKKARTSILDKTENENLVLFMSSGFAFTELYFKPNTGGYEALKNSDYFGKFNNTDFLRFRCNHVFDGRARRRSGRNAP